jgi:hypothetical protein
MGEDISLYHPADMSWTNPFSLWVQRNPGSPIGPLSQHALEIA